MSTKSVFGLLLVLAQFVPVRADDELGRRSTWSVPTAEQVRKDLDGWLATRPVDANLKKQIDALWIDQGLIGVELLDALAATIALVEPAARPVVEFCSTDAAKPVLPKFAILVDDSAAPLVRHNLRLVYARWLAQSNFADEALDQLNGLEPADVVDPASLLFYRSVAHHRLLEKEQCLTSITRLLENPDAIPQRYESLVRLMEADVKPLKKDSLDEVARLMVDIQRRLGFGRAGKKVRQEEDDVVAKLDKMIEELEKQQQQQQNPGSGNGGNMQPASPMQDSMLPGGRGDGNVDPKKLGARSGWGNLPPRERQEALQQISKDLPAHYREVIEEYFRKIAPGQEP